MAAVLEILVVLLVINSCESVLWLVVSWVLSSLVTPDLSISCYLSVAMVTHLVLCPKRCRRSWFQEDQSSVNCPKSPMSPLRVRPPPRSSLITLTPRSDFPPLYGVRVNCNDMTDSILIFCVHLHQCSPVHSPVWLSFTCVGGAVCGVMYCGWDFTVNCCKSFI